MPYTIEERNELDFYKSFVSELRNAHINAIKEFIPNKFRDNNRVLQSFEDILSGLGLEDANLEDGGVLYENILFNPNMEGMSEEKTTEIMAYYDSVRNSMLTIQDKKLKVAGQPKIDLKTFGEGKDLNFELQLDLLPEIKIIVCLRNPVKRAYSHYNDLGVRLGNEKRTFDEAIKDEIKIIEEKKFNITNFEYGFEDRLYQYVSRGIYLDHLKIWMETFSKEQILIVKTEELNKNPKKVLEKIFEFLSLPNFDDINIKKKYNVSKYEPMNNSTKELLKTFFKEHNKRLEDYLQMDFNWND